MAFALIGVLVALAVLGVFAFVGVAVSKAKGETEAIERMVAMGDASSLAPWDPTLLGWMSKDVIGSSFYYRPMGGARTSKVAMIVPAWQGPANIVAIRREAVSRGGHDKIDLLAGGLRLALGRYGHVWRIYADGYPFGSIDPHGGGLFDPNNAPAGHHRRVGGAVYLQVRGAEVAQIDTDATLHDARPASLRPLVRLASATPSREAAVWLLALCAVELGTHLMMGGSASMGVP